MIETALTAFTTFFATIGPIESAVLFATLTPRLSRRERRSISLRATLIATLIVLASAIVGGPVLQQLGVSVAALKAAGGAILFFIAHDMIFARQSGGISLSRAESLEAEGKAEITVFPLATPILAGPGAMSGAILMMARTREDLLLQGVVILTLLAVMLITLLLLLIAQELHERMGITAQKVIMRVFGILIAAVAVQSIFDGIAESGIFAKTG